MVAVCLCFAFSTNAFSQDDQVDKLTFGKEYAPDEIKAPYFGMGAGYTGSFYFPTFDDLNLKLTEFGFGNEVLAAPVYLNGFEVFTSIPYLRNFKLSFNYKKGSLNAEYNTSLAADESVTVHHSADYTIDLVGFNVNYCFTVYKNLSINPGVGFGGGNLTFDIAQTQSNTTWDKINPDATTNNYSFNTAAGFLYIQPNLNVEYAFTPWLLARVAANYNVSFMNVGLLGNNEWQLNNTATIQDVPSNISANGYAFEFGIYLGLFNIN